MHKCKLNGGSRREGFGMNLYRNTDKGKLAGVCAGLADHFEIDQNIMRIIFIVSFLFMGPVTLLLYAIAWIILSPRGENPGPLTYEYDEHRRCYRKKKILAYRQSASARLKTAADRLRETSERVQNIERYVTSRRFTLDKQFSDLERE